jgi:para-aminobenzoate synthetase/4-amino-4-deoxychorismate lyase
LVGRLRPARAGLVAVPGGAVVGASPELFLARRGDRVATAPIKGTRPLSGPAEEQGEDDVLRGSVKDAAENVMIVDLMRNDLSAVCLPGTVEVSALLDVAAHAGVWHLVSRVEGDLPARTPHARLLAATFPPGSVTGVPKVRALEVMAAAEKEVDDGPRGVYTGAYGFASPVAGLELAVAIRTLEVAGGRARLGVGGGVTAGSTPVEEWAECLVKAAPLLEALGAGPLPLPARERTPAAALFETVLVRDGVVLEAADHAERLTRSWWELTGRPLGPAPAAALHEAAAALGPGWHRLRLDVDAAGHRTTAASVPAPRPIAGRPGVELRVATVGVQGLPRHKLADRELLADLEARAGIEDHDAAAALLVDPGGLVLESTRANVLAVVDGALRTPPLDGRILPGVTRQVLLDLADDLRVPVRIGPLPLTELTGADGVVLVNAVRGVMWAARLGTRHWPAPDPVGTALAAALLARWNAPWDAPGVRLSEFWTLVDDEFGRAHGRTLVRDHVVGALGHRTAEQALEAGEEPREVWLALVADLEIPRERWWGRDAAGPRRRS